MKIFYLLLLFLWGVALPLHAYDFVCDSIYYNITSSYNLTVEVTRGDVKYAGNISVPSVVEYRGRAYRVTAVGFYAFSLCGDLKSITLPNSIEFIDSYAFYRCTGLRSIVIPLSVARVGEGVFEGCTELREIRGKRVFDLFSRKRSRATI